jgi:hypothetical protein
MLLEGYLLGNHINLVLLLGKANKQGRTVREGVDGVRSIFIDNYQPPLGLIRCN